MIETKEKMDKEDKKNSRKLVEKKRRRWTRNSAKRNVSTRHYAVSICRVCVGKEGGLKVGWMRGVAEWNDLEGNHTQPARLPLENHSRYPFDFQSGFITLLFVLYATFIAYLPLSLRSLLNPLRNNNP